MDVNILQSFVVLMLAVGILGGILFMLKKITKKRNENKTTVSLNVISKISLQPKNHLFVVKAADKLLVLGVSENNINILTELDASFEATIQGKSNDTIKDEVMSKLATSKLSQSADLSFLNFVKSSFKFGH